MADDSPQPTTPDDPFSGFDWSQQDHLHTTPPPSSVPAVPASPTYSSAPSPGTYYSNNQGFTSTGSRRAGTLTAFMVLEWITFGFACLGTCGSCFSLAGLGLLAASASLTTFYVVSTIVNAAFVIATLFFSFNAAKGIGENLKSGIKAGYVEVTLSWISVAFSLVTQILFTIIGTSGSTEDETYASSIIFTIAALSIGLILPVAKTILLLVPASKQSIERDFR